jgi:thioesterase domain-containing protein
MELPPHAVPGRVVLVDELPTTAHGKLDVAKIARRAQEELAETLETPLEGLLEAAFAEVLGRRHVGQNEDFFTAGGHSLLAFRLLSRLERVLGIPLEPSLLLRAATPRSLAREIERLKQPAADSPSPPVSPLLVPVTPGDRRLFFMPGGEGGDLSIGFYARLAFYLPNTSFWGLRVRDSWNRGKKRWTVEEMAADCIREIRKAQPEGPYDLGGGCTGGIVAFEMARQMAAAGLRVGKLVLIDTTFPSLLARRRQLLRVFSSRTRRRARELLEFLSFLPQWRRRSLYNRVSRLLPFDETEADANVPEEWMRFADAVLAYRPRPYSGRGVLLASEELREGAAPRRWAAAFTGGLREIALPGTHFTYIRDHIAQVGEALRQVLEEDRPDGAV